MNADKRRCKMVLGSRNGSCVEGAQRCRALWKWVRLPYLTFLILSAFIFVHLRLPLTYAAPQRVVDRIVATIEGVPVTASELADLGRFQQLNGGAPTDEKELLRRRIEQWIIAADAEGSRFPRPSEEEVERELVRLTGQFASPAAYQARLRELGLRAVSVKQLLAQQIYLARYLDARFRPTVQVEEAQIAAYYQGELAQQVQARGQSLPPLDSVREQIRELLLQRQISERAGRWLDENRARVKVVLHGGPQPGGAF